MRQGDFGMEHWQKMYFISMKAHDKTLQCNVDVTIMQQISIAFRFFGPGLFSLCGYIWYVLGNFEIFCDLRVELIACHSFT